MYPAGKAADSRNIDRFAIEKGAPSLILMENAAFSLYLETVKIVENFKPEKIVLFAGKGGNGGDGFALLRILRDRGCSIPMNIVKFFELNELKGDSLQNWKMLPSDISSTEMKKIKGRTLFIDGMVGTGLKNNLTGRIREAVTFINSYKDKYVLSIDVPTGLDSDKGIEMPEAVIADTTVTMGIYKTGLFAQNGPAACGKIVLGKISAVDAGTSDTKYEVVEDLIPEPLKIPVDSYKNRNGHCLVIGGDIDKLGASLIAARSFMASGGGLVTAAFEKSLHKKIAGLVPGMMLTDIETAEHQLDRYSSII
ncbi:MAG TPA: NAD(P)H-hydrate epimerase, partial [bacterium]|nr:NAD(P)H-hydrate epimerase [bacterium]